jgi:hypothetical protein
VEEVTISGDGTSGGGDEGILEGPSVGSDSEGEPERDEEPDTAEDMYPEEILTYKRRPRQSMVVEDHTLEASAVDEVISEDENAPEMGDFAVIEPWGAAYCMGDVLAKTTLFSRYFRTLYNNLFFVVHTELDFIWKPVVNNVCEERQQ